MFPLPKPPPPPHPSVLLTTPVPREISAHVAGSHRGLSRARSLSWRRRRLLRACPCGYRLCLLAFRQHRGHLALVEIPEYPPSRFGRGRAARHRGPAEQGSPRGEGGRRGRAAELAGECGGAGGSTRSIVSSRGVECFILTFQLWCVVMYYYSAAPDTAAAAADGRPGQNQQYFPRTVCPGYDNLHLHASSIALT